MSEIVANQVIEGAEPWYAGVKPMHWRILTASFMRWIFDGFESFALFLVLPMMLKSLLTRTSSRRDRSGAASPSGGNLLGWGPGLCRP